MPTIKDIAKAAGVSHGTVSNVLTGKGNVSVEKILLVEKYAREMGYVLNRSAKLLRSKKRNAIAVILPGIEMETYRDFFLAAKAEVEAQDYTVSLYLTADAAENEEKMVSAVVTERLSGIIAVSCADVAHSPYARDRRLALPPTVFAERRPVVGVKGVVGTFDFAGAGRDIGAFLLHRGACEVAVFSDTTEFSHECDCLRGLEDALRGQEVRLRFITASPAQMIFSAVSLFEENPPLDFIVTTTADQARCVRSAFALSGREHLPPILSMASARAIREEDGLIRYELDYKKLGKLCARAALLLAQGKKARSFSLENDGLTRAYAGVFQGGQTTVRLLTLESPASRALFKLLPLCQKQTGVRLELTVLTQRELYDTVFATMDNCYFDMIRMDVLWLSSMAERIFMPLSALDFEFGPLFDSFLGDLPDDYTTVRGVRYALPFDPSMLLLYYRRDLFEDPIMRRMYYEMHREELHVPTTYAQYNKVAAFFTRSLHPESPTTFGLTTAMGVPTSVACEFLPRLYDFGAPLSGPDGQLQIDTPQACLALHNQVESFRYSSRRTDNWWRHCVEAFFSGQAAMAIVFINHAADIAGSRMAEFTHRVGFANIPGGRPILGGGVLGFARNAKDREAAFELTRWLYHPDTATAMTYLGGLSPCRHVFGNCDILARFPWLAAAKHSFATGTRRLRGITNLGFNEKDFETILGAAVRQAVLGDVAPEEALRQVQAAWGR